MNILLITGSFPPEIGSASHLFYELSQGLAENGHNVTVITRFPRAFRVNSPETYYRRKFFLSERIGDVRVLRIAELPIFKESLFSRLLEQVILPLALLLGGLISGTQDIILNYSPPLTLGLAAFVLSKMKRAPFIVNVQDLHPKAIVDLGLLKNQIVIRILETLERFIYCRAKYLTVHSEGNRKHVISRGAQPHTVLTIPNWADTNLRPLEKFNKFRTSNKLGSKSVITYAGIFSYSQDLDTILDCASILREHNDIVFLLVGDGPLKSSLMAKANALKLDNMIFIPFQPRERYPLVLSASDICLVALRKNGVKTPVVPRKLQDIMASGRPVIANVPLDGDVPKIIRGAHCGICVESENPKELAEAILKLCRNPSLRDRLGRNGERYANKHYSLSTCLQKYQTLFEQATDTA